MFRAVTKEHCEHVLTHAEFTRVAPETITVRAARPGIGERTGSVLGNPSMTVERDECSSAASFFIRFRRVSSGRWRCPKALRNRRRKPFQIVPMRRPRDGEARGHPVSDGARAIVGATERRAACVQRNAPEHGANSGPLKEGSGDGDAPGILAPLKEEHPGAEARAGRWSCTHRCGGNGLGRGNLDAKREAHHKRR